MPRFARSVPALDLVVVMIAKKVWMAFSEIGMGEKFAMKGYKLWSVVVLVSVATTFLMARWLHVVVSYSLHTDLRDMINSRSLNQSGAPNPVSRCARCSPNPEMLCNCIRIDIGTHWRLLSLFSHVLRMDNPMASPTYVSIKEFGAIGDGSTDNTAALQATFNYAAANKIAVYIPPGNYNYSGVLQANGIVVFGAGAATQLTATAAGSEALYLTGTNPALYNLSITGAGGSRLSTNNSALVVPEYATGFTVENVNVANSASVGIFTIDSTNGNILHNTVQGTMADGIYTTVGSSFINIKNNLTKNTGDDAISVSSYVGDPGYTNNILISNNTVVGNWESRSITVNGGEHITITNNYINGGTAGISVGSESEWNTRATSNVTVTGNTIMNTTYTGEGTIGGGAISLYSDVGVTGVTIANNNIYSPAHDAVFVAGTSQIQASIRNNTVYASSSTPAYVNKNPNAINVTISQNVMVAATTQLPSPLVGNGVNDTVQLPIAYPSGSLILFLSEDAYQGNAQFIASVDGQVLGEAQLVTALHSTGASQPFFFSGNFGSGTHKIGVTFTNDLYGGSPSADRNLYVNSLTFNGTHYALSASMYSDGTCHFMVGG